MSRDHNHCSPGTLNRSSSGHGAINRLEHHGSHSYLTLKLEILIKTKTKYDLAIDYQKCESARKKYCFELVNSKRLTFGAQLSLRW